MAEPTRIEVSVLGERLSIRTSASSEYLRGLGAFGEERARALGAGTRSPTSVLLLTALDIADELFRTRDEQSRHDVDLGTRLGSLVHELQRACPPGAAGPKS